MTSVMNTVSFVPANGRRQNTILACDLTEARVLWLKFLDECLGVTPELEITAPRLSVVPNKPIRPIVVPEDCRTNEIYKLLGEMIPVDSFTKDLSGIIMSRRHPYPSTYITWVSSGFDPDHDLVGKSFDEIDGIQPKVIGETLLEHLIMQAFDIWVQRQRNKPKLTLHNVCRITFCTGSITDDGRILTVANCNGKVAIRRARKDYKHPRLAPRRVFFDEYRIARQ